MFTIIPSKKINESSIGFLLRIAKRHGITHREYLLNHAEMMRIVKGDKAKNPELHFLHQGPLKQCIAQSPLFQKSIMLTPKVCPLCLENDGFHYEKWNNIFEATCDKHQINLLTKCTYCSQILAWQPIILEGKCTNSSCGRKLQAQWCDVQMNHSQTADCLLANHIVHHYADNYIRTTKYPPIHNYETDVQNGLTFLNDPACARTWVSGLIEQNDKLPFNFRTVKKALMLEHLSSSWPAQNELRKAAKPSIVIPTNNKVGSFIVKASVARNLIGASTEELQALSDNRIIQIIGNTRLCVTSLIDISGVVSLLSTAKPYEEMKCLATYQHLMVYFDVGITDLLLGYRNEKLQLGYKAGQHLLSSLYCTSSDLEKFCEEHFNNIRKEIMTIDKAMRLINAPQEELMKLRKIGAFRLPRGGNDNYVVFDDVLTARKQFHIQSEFNFDGYPNALSAEFNE
ncbi:MAG: hypothetical protein ACJAS1_005646 [Oleiphilaceae bacterium]|jgi:hypothetical protein